MKYSASLLFTFLLFISAGYAQDEHFSHFMYSPTRTNPSLVAVSNDFTLNLLNRRQWSSIVNPFTSYYLNSSMPLLYRNNYRWGAAGLSFFHNSSGENGLLKITQLSGTFAYNIYLNKVSSISLGIQPTWISKMINTESLTSGSQWINGSFHPNASLGDEFSNTSISFFEISAGALWYNVDNKGTVRSFSGLSFSNINQPRENFILDQDKLPLRITYTGGIRIFENRNVVVAPKVLLMYQARTYNFMAGSNVNLKFINYSHTDILEDGEIGIGLYYRLGDAVMLSAEFIQPRYRIGLSHDFNMFRLSKNLKLAGATEVFLGYRLPVKRKRGSYKSKPGKIQYSGYKASKKKINKPEEKEKDKGILHTKVFLAITDLESSEGIRVNIKLNKDQVKSFSIFTVDSSYVKDSTINFTLPHFAELEVEITSKDYFYKKFVIKTLAEDTLNLTTTLQKAEEGKNIVLENILFDNMSEKLDTSSYRELDKLATFLLENPELKVEISGHSDDVGSRKFNNKLSQERAQAVVDYLIGRTISKDRLVSKGYGEDMPLDLDQNESSRSKNRRVELKIISR